MAVIADPSMNDTRSAGGAPLSENTPAILYVMLTMLIGTFQYFLPGWLLTGGGPNMATEFYSIYLYRNAFRFFKMGYASALAWVLFLVIVLFTIAIFRSSARWVHYSGMQE